MIIGIDFDNTIIRYDNVFGAVALKNGVITNPNLKNKSDVKSFLIASGRETDWTELQGKVYGSHINEAKPYDNFLKVCQDLIFGGHELKIISHKTKYPFLGERVNLREAAMDWLIEKKIVGKTTNKIDEKRVFFCNTIEQKVQEISKQKCDVFIDDLMDVLDLVDNSIVKVFFDPAGKNRKSGSLRSMKSWNEIGSFLNVL